MVALTPEAEALALNELATAVEAVVAEHVESIAANIAQMTAGLNRVLAIVEAQSAMLERYRPLLEKAEQRFAKPSLFGRRDDHG